ncbi:formate dehydrogenase beta subunit [Thalassotalea sp. ND16A]|uniref:formate dehydrogenase beta subunit n=1 Tax=Thalassotalea sp. ND16A TaxID=1535422 RepID=UPI000519FFC5|nr:formate dehydrogenase beta subunit [Thalassotalea sp. ND16A]KGJ95983.1 NADH dehydrogenase (quinone) [Thalassotalea sp. ND16A]
MAAIKLYIPDDTTAVAMGADDVCQAISNVAKQKDIEIEVVRNGSRGLFYLEPLVEVATSQGRVAYGPVTVDDIESLFAADFIHAGKHPLAHGLTEEIPFLKNQQRLTFARVGITEPLSLSDYQQHDGFKGLQKALTHCSQELVDIVKESGLRGRGGAAFPAGIKWQTVLDARGSEKYIVCNADEGDSGTFSDRMIMEADPYVLIEGMVIAGLAVGAEQGYIYLRSEYPKAAEKLTAAITLAEQAGFLGNNIGGSNNSFTLELRIGAGAYICGEETALLESLEGKRGMVRAKPPLPAIEGLFGQPTIVNNVITLATIPIILAKGGQYYQDFGMGRSRGTLPMQLAGNIKQGGLVELAFGCTLEQLVFEFGQGTYSAKPAKAIQVGGPLGAYLPKQQWQTPLDYESFTAISAVLGHGGVVVFDETADMAAQARFAMEFCKVESCGKCTPCRIGSTRGIEVIDKITNGQDSDANLQLLADLCDTMVVGSLCAMGGMTPFPVQSIMQYFGEELLPKDSLAKEVL